MVAAPWFIFKEVYMDAFDLGPKLTCSRPLLPGETVKLDEIIGGTE